MRSSSVAPLSQYLPVLLFGAIGGAAADRLDRKRLSFVPNLARWFCLAMFTT